MPQLDKCASCQAPIFDVDGVPGACACDDGIYHTLLARQRHENGRGRPRTASTATDRSLEALARQGAPEPALDPFMFLSPVARRELEAAQQARPPIRGVTPDSVLIDDGVDFEALARDDIPTDGLDDFEFATVDDDAPVLDYPLSRNRFRVDRPPVRDRFIATQVPGPQGGPMRPVGQAGRFQVLGEVEPAPRQIIERLTTLRESVQQRGLEALHERATQTRVEAQTLNARQQEKRAALHETLPTAYDRVAGDFLADADDFD